MSTYLTFDPSDYPEKSTTVVLTTTANTTTVNAGTLGTAKLGTELKSRLVNGVETPIVTLANLIASNDYYIFIEEINVLVFNISITSVKDNLELVYRMGRIYHKQNNAAKAISNYELTLKNGASYSYYYAANAALQLGLICEEQKNIPLAKEYFNQCLALKNHEYQNSISQKAKAGLNRIKK